MLEMKIRLHLSKQNFIIASACIWHTKHTSLNSEQNTRGTILPAWGNADVAFNSVVMFLLHL